MNAVKVEAQRFTGFKLLHHEYLKREQEQSGQVNQRGQQGIARQKFAFFREYQRKMQEQCRLEHPGSGVGPEDDPVKGV